MKLTDTLLVIFAAANIACIGWLVWIVAVHTPLGGAAVGIVGSGIWMSVLREMDAQRRVPFDDGKRVVDDDWESAK